MNSAAARLVWCAARPPTLAQGSIVFGPICHPAPLFGDMVTASSIGFERHRGSRVIGGVVLLRQPSPHANRPIRATNSSSVPPHTCAAHLIDQSDHPARIDNEAVVKI